MSEKTTDTDIRNALLCALIAVVATLATLPFTETPINDDWAFNRMALDFAALGRIRPNGWSVPIVGFQAVWGGLFAKAFGFSFTLMRLSLLPFLAGCAVLLYLLLRRGGVAAAAAILGTLTVLVSPILLPVAASFMTDVTGLFFILLTIYATIRAAETQEKATGGLAGWVIAAVVAGYLGGTIRQVIWAAPLVPLSYLAFRRRDGRWLIILVTVGMLVLAAATQLWYQKQPYSISEDLRAGLVHIVKMPTNWVPLMTKQTLTLFLFLLPVLAVVLPKWWRDFAGRQAVRISVVIGALVITLLMQWRNDLAPWIGNIVTSRGIVGENPTMLGELPVTLPAPVRLVLTFLSLLFAGLAAARATLGVRAFLAENAGETLQRRAFLLYERWLTLPLTVQYMVLFTVPYTFMLMPRAALGYAFDRYVIPVLPLVALLCLRGLPRLESRTELRASLIPGWAAFAVYALYSIATTHNYAATVAAEQRMIDQLTSSGVARREIHAGFEHDSWHELETRGFYNSPQYSIPVGAYIKPGPDTYPKVFEKQPYRFWWEHAPSLSYRYFVVLSPVKGLQDTAFPPVEYQMWLPPFTRTTHVQQLPEGAVIASPITVPAASEGANRL